MFVVRSCTCTCEIPCIVLYSLIPCVALCSVDRQLLKDAFKKYSVDFDLYYTLFPDEERTYEKYVGEMDFSHVNR